MSAVLHILFHLDSEPCTDVDVIISEEAIRAAIHFVEVCGQHVAFIAGRSEIEEEIKLLELGIGLYVECNKCTPMPLLCLLH